MKSNFFVWGMDPHKIFLKKLKNKKNTSRPIKMGAKHDFLVAILFHIGFFFVSSKQGHRGSFKRGVPNSALAAKTTRFQNDDFLVGV